MLPTVLIVSAVAFSMSILFIYNFFSPSCGNAKLKTKHYYRCNCAADCSHCWPEKLIPPKTKWLQDASSLVWQGLIPKLT